MAMSTRASLRVDTLAELRKAPTSDGALVTVIGRDTRTDGMGAFYQWVAGSTTPEDLTFYNVIASSTRAGGRWVRVYQRTRARGATDFVAMNGSMRTLFAYGVTDANGEVTVMLTEDGTAGTPSLFDQVWMTVGQATVNAASPNDIVTGVRKSLSADLKTATYRFARGNSQTLGGTLSALLGVVITGFRVPPTGTPVVIRVDGI